MGCPRRNQTALAIRIAYIENPALDWKLSLLTLYWNPNIALTAGTQYLTHEFIYGFMMNRPL